MEAELVALVASVATTLLGAAVTDSYTQAKNRIARFLARRSRDDEAVVAEELEQDGQELAQARAAGDEAAADRIEGDWRLRLVRMAEDEPGLVRELRLLARELNAERAPGGGAAGESVVFAGTVVHGGIPYQVRPHGTPGEVPDDVPPLRVEYINRVTELAAAAEMLSGAARDGDGGRVGVMVLCGPPGVGKTALAIRSAHASKPLFPDGRLYVDFAELRGLSGGADVSAAMEKCLRSLGVEGDLPLDRAALGRMYRWHLRKRRVLLVLDDVSEPAQVEALLPNGPGSAVVVTGNAGGLGELAVSGAELLTLAPLDRESALRLLAGRCPGAVAADPEAAGRLVELCGGLPVALHVVAARLAAGGNALTAAGLADELADDSRRLDAMSLRGERPVTAVFDSAYRQLQPEVARVYRLLGLLPVRTFDAGTAAAVTGTEVEVVAGRLDMLVGAGLLERGPDGRYRFHDLVRLHAREHALAGEPPEAGRAVTERLIRHYLVLTALADRAVRAERLRIAHLEELLRGVPDPFAKPGGPAPLDWLAAERATIMTVLRAASALGLHTPVWQLAEAFTVLFLHGRYLADWRESLELGATAAAAAEELVPAAEARLRSLLSRPLMDLGEYEEARRQLETALACAEVAGRAEVTASVMEFFGRYWDHADPARAMGAYRRSIELNLEAGEERGVAIVTLFLGRAQDAAGEHARALETLRRAHRLLLDRTPPDLRMAARATAAIGRALDRLGRTEEAVPVLREAVEALRESKASHYEAEALLDLVAIAERPGGDRTHIRADLARAVEIHERSGQRDAAELRARLEGLGEG
ncbi:ATP-binding protein [Streptomyces pyxinae]|uniref:ATP-binding protein n=1 Tax=Streptomyces pyxinae TaxID=2970734 RepID=UPI002867BB88|nr:NB-ARC domain-containing protein [Streptomyces sp. LP05-1]